jgi:flagellin
MSDITLSTGIRQNLLSLQQTSADLTTTQEQLATGKKVNSAFDNPTSYFTSQSLTNRANSLNALLDQVGQATQTLQAANQGLTSITSLLQQALSTAQQALQAPGPSTIAYGAITTNGTLKTRETAGALTSGAALGTTLGASNDTLNIVAAGTTYSVTLANTDTVAAVVNQINNTTGLGSTGAVTASTTAGGALILTSNSAGTSFSASDSNGETGLSTLGVATAGSALGTTLGANNDTLSIVTASNTYSVTLVNTDTVAAVVNQINGTTGLGATGAITASTSAGGKLILTANNSSVSFTASNNNNEAGFTTPGTGTSVNTAVAGNSTDLFQILQAQGITAGDALTFQVSGGATQQIQFGTSTGQVQTLAQLQTALQGLSGISSASASGNSVSINVASSTALNSLTTGSSGSAGATAILNELGLTAGTVSGTALASGNNAARTTLQGNYNALLTQIDQLAQDSSFSGVNLLSGNNLEVVFNENNTSSLTIQGVTYSSAGLGLTAITGTGFQSNSNIQNTVSAINAALSNVQSQTETFGTNASTIQIRQNFIKNLVNTLQTGSDNLVLADQNQESANLLTLQTRQQLSISALSISNQAQQAVLKLFP